VLGSGIRATASSCASEWCLPLPLPLQKVHHRQEPDLLAREEKPKIYEGSGAGDATETSSTMVLQEKESVSLRRRGRLDCCIEASKVVVASTNGFCSWK
jgi:hypothetical protein